eukprot:TRINITY_DN2522_c0_g1_i1.p1 TRINITY_DN2522_c0_g1~~TRINITY_DN2522_c0_g1_i1.p1  ORF type:complete len:106 (-),score=25.09 TRINITY_DN2522_c0_g1_i1:145-462(-)
MIELDLEGQKCMVEPLTLATEANQSLNTIENAVQEIRTNSKIAKTAVSLEFTEMRKTLEKREHELISAIEAKEKEKVQEAEQKCRVLRKALKDISQVKEKSRKVE